MTDFGIAKAISQAAGSSGLTSVGMAIGTPTYMAPEQAAGDPNVDHRADIYSFGAMAYDILTGRPPFDGMSPHQMLAAHIADAVEPITKRRDHLPDDLAVLVMSCLEKNAADRPQTATELVQVLEGAATPTTGTRAMRAARQRRNRWAAVGITAVVVVAATWGVFRSGTPAVNNDDLVAVAPFDVLDPALQLWREGMVDLLSRSLDGAGPLRTVSPTVVVKRWSGHADPTAARALGHATGARTVVYGGLVSSGPDSVRLTANVLDVSNGNSLGEIDLRDHKDHLDRIADSLAVRVLGEIGATRVRGLGLVHATKLGSASLPAIKAFLTGEQYLRHSQWDSALTAYQEAVGHDSGFTLAWAHGGLAAGWGRSGSDSLATRYQLRAGSMNHGLAPRDSFLIQADSLMSMVFLGPQFLGGSWWTYGKRAVATLEEAVRRYPDDPDLWYGLGDARFHAGDLAGESPRQSLDAFERAIALDSTFSPAYVHPMQLAATLDGPEASRRYAAAYLKAGAGGRFADEARWILRLLDPKLTDPAARARIVDSAAAVAGSDVVAAVLSMHDSGELVVRLGDALAIRRLRTAVTPGDTTNALFIRSLTLALRGHVREAYRIAGYRSSLLGVEMAMLGAVPADSMDAVVAAAGANRRDAFWTAFPYWASRGDTVHLRQMEAYVDSIRRHPPPNLPAIAQGILGYLSQSGQAYLALARRDTTAALRLFDALPDSACYGNCPLDQLVHAQLLEARGRTQDAATRLAKSPSFLNRTPFPADILWVLERGRVNERLGNKDIARASYAEVAGLWANGDAALKPYVDESRAGIARLSGDTKH